MLSMLDVQFARHKLFQILSQFVFFFVRLSILLKEFSFWLARLSNGQGQIDPLSKSKIMTEAVCHPLSYNIANNLKFNIYCSSRVDLFAVVVCYESKIAFVWGKLSLFLFFFYTNKANFHFLKRITMLKASQNLFKKRDKDCF